MFSNTPLVACRPWLRWVSCLDESFRQGVLGAESALLHCILSVVGSCKLPRTCTAYISCTINMTTGRVHVSYCSLHVGHDTELCHLRLSSKVRLQVATLLHQGVPVSSVMDRMRDLLDSAVERDKLLSRLVERLSTAVMHVMLFHCIWHVHEIILWIHRRATVKMFQL